MTETAKNVIKNTNNTTQSVEKSLLSNWVKSSNDRPCSSYRAESITFLLVNCVAFDLQPLSLCEDSGMRALLQYIEPNYVPPTGTTLQKHLIKHQNKKTRKTVVALVTRGQIARWMGFLV